MTARLLTFLSRHRRLAIDTNIFIYQLQAVPWYIQLTIPIFNWLEQPNHSAVTSTITMTELLVHPYRNSDMQLVNQLFGLLSTYRNLEWVAPTLEIADTAARLRATHRLKTPDALQAATAITANASGMVTNDAMFERVTEFETLVLDVVV